MVPDSSFYLTEKSTISGRSQLWRTTRANNYLAHVNIGWLFDRERNGACNRIW